MLSKLKRHFLAAMPVLGPHQGIELGFFYYSKKPVIEFTVENPNEQQMVAMLDYGVEEGDLVAIDKPIHTRIQYDNGKTEVRRETLRAYASPEDKKTLEETVDMLRSINAKEGFERARMNYRIGRNFGYRRRDALYFSFFDAAVPESLRPLLHRLNKGPLKAYQSKFKDGIGVIQLTKH